MHIVNAVVVALLALVSSAHGINVCANQAGNTVLPNANDCSSYYYCMRWGGPLLMYCPKGYSFSTLLSTCVPDVFDECRVTYVLRHAESLAGLLCDRHKATTDMQPYPEDNTKFYVCHQGMAIVQECPKGMFFHTRLHICMQTKAPMTAEATPTPHKQLSPIEHTQQTHQLLKRPEAENFYDKLSSKFVAL